MKNHLLDILPVDAVRLEVSQRVPAAILRELAGLLGPGAGRPLSQIARLLAEREAQASTGIGEGVAIPHCRVEGLTTFHACLAMSHPGVRFGAVDGRPVHIFVGLLSPLDRRSTHVPLLARIARLLKSPSFRKELLVSKSPAAARALIGAEERALEAEWEAKREASGVDSPPVGRRGTNTRGTELPMRPPPPYGRPAATHHAHSSLKHPPR